jgi:hypothetical protein
LLASSFKPSIYLYISPTALIKAEIEIKIKLSIYYLSPHPLNPPLLKGEGESIYKRGALAPLKHPLKLGSLLRGGIEKRGAKPPSKTTSPLPAGEGG